MTDRGPSRLRVFRPGAALGVLTFLLGWVIVAAISLGLLGREKGALVIASAAVAQWLTVIAAVWFERARWVDPLRRISARIELLARDHNEPIRFEELPGAVPLIKSLSELSAAYKRASQGSNSLLSLSRGSDSGIVSRSALARNALLETTSDVFEFRPDSQGSGEYSSTDTDMVNRLEPKLLRWLESSQAEQVFLGWGLKQLREKSFLEIVHPDDLARVKEQLGTALIKGEVHGLILRIRTAHGKPKAIEMNVGARYASDMTVSHLRCHITDVTAKVRSDRELRLRTRELTQVNEQLRLINRELEELKERYRDLYQNAPAMYFSLDRQGRFIECNETLLRTIGFRGEDLIGDSYEVLLPETVRPLFAERFASFLRAGSIEITTQWVKANGEVIDVLVTGTAVRASDGRIIHSRSIAHDVTMRHRLEAELQEKNDRLARTIDELSRRNKEMDEFTYVVSHDLQEPLRTLTAFSDFLSRDYGERLDAEGQEFVRYIVDASRRMRSLIQDLLSLSRVGKVTAEFSEVNLDEVVGVVRADLSELIRSKSAEVRVIGSLPGVWGDRHRLGQLMANLISNGLKYNDKASPVVEIGALHVDSAGSQNEEHGRNGSVQIYVRDNGIGIEPQFHAKIFQLFRRLHTREEYEGTGAGLAICEKIVQAHDGRIWVESEPKRGTTFFVSLSSVPHDCGAPALSSSIDRPHDT